MNFTGFDNIQNHVLFPYLFLSACNKNKIDRAPKSQTDSLTFNTAEKTRLIPKPLAIKCSIRYTLR